MPQLCCQGIHIHNRACTFSVEALVVVAAVALDTWSHLLERSNLNM